MSFSSKVGIESGFVPDVRVPCGQCEWCRIDRSRNWAMRCVHESSLYISNCFLTLTFNAQHLPENRSLDVRHLQLFFKRLRKALQSMSWKCVTQGVVATPRESFGYYACGEYGDRYQRPHYHVCLFGFDFPDKKVFSTSSGFTTYTSKALEILWPFGFCLVAELNFDTAAYTARYVTKKLTGRLAESAYVSVDDETGEMFDVKPEFATMSRRPGIGRGWYEQYRDQTYRADSASVYLNGRLMRPPLAYDRWLAIDDAQAYAELEWRRQQEVVKAEQNPDNTPRRTWDKSVVFAAKQKLFAKRRYDAGNT